MRSGILYARPSVTIVGTSTIHISSGPWLRCPISISPSYQSTCSCHCALTGNWNGGCVSSWDVVCLPVLLLSFGPGQPSLSWPKIPHVRTVISLYSYIPQRLNESKITDGVATLFLWGEVEEWVVLITMCIPPVWPLFRPYAQQFIKNTSSRSHPRNYTLPYNRTAQEASSSKVAWPPRVTTTISVTSVMDKTAVPSRTSSEFILKHNEHHGETPYNNVFHDKKTQDTWVELSDLEEHPNRRWCERVWFINSWYVWLDGIWF